MVMMMQFMQTSMQQQWAADEKRCQEHKECRRQEAAREQRWERILARTIDGHSDPGSPWPVTTSTDRIICFCQLEKGEDVWKLTFQP